MKNPCESAEAEPQHLFSEETLQSLRDLGEVLRDIYDQAVSEGYVFEGGRIYNPVSKNQSDAEECEQ